MDIKPCGSAPSRKTPADYFTGTVWQDPIIEAPPPARIRSAWVRFEPGARTAWHTHPLGQTGCRAGAGRSTRCAPATRCGSRPTRSTGMAPLPIWP
jgi:hypothetical protein